MRVRRSTADVALKIAVISGTCDELLLVFPQVVGKSVENEGCEIFASGGGSFPTLLTWENVWKA